MLCQLLEWCTSRCSGVNAAGTQRLTSGSMKLKAAGITPTTVNGCPLMRTSRPSASWLPKSCRLRPSLRIAF